jgi:hypothetical protein
MISDNDLLLYYYRDGLDAAERERIASALSEQPELAARLHRLVAQLDAAAATPEVPVPEHVQERWRAALSRASTREAAPAEKPRRELFSTFRWQIATAALAGVLLVVSVRVAMQSAPNGLDTTPSPVQTAAVGATDASAYERGLRFHLANTESQLATLDTASDEERIRLIETIIAQNRLYAIAAERADEPQLARVLRAFTPILERLADNSGDAAAGEIAQLNFEMKVMQARLAATTSNRSTEQPVL